MRNRRLKLVLLTIGSFIVSIAPLVTVLVLKRTEYFKTVQDTFKLSVGGAILVIFLLAKVTKRLTMPREIVVEGTVFVLAWLFEALLADLLLLSGMALLGGFLDWSIFDWQIRRMREDLTAQRTARVMASEMEPVIQRHIGNGRV